MPSVLFCSMFVLNQTETLWCPMHLNVPAPVIQNSKQLRHSVFPVTPEPGRAYRCMNGGVVAALGERGRRGQRPPLQTPRAPDVLAHEHSLAVGFFFFRFSARIGRKALISPESGKGTAIFCRKLSPFCSFSKLNGNYSQAFLTRAQRRRPGAGSSPYGHELQSPRRRCAYGGSCAGPGEGEAAAWVAARRGGRARGFLSTSGARSKTSSDRPVTR